MASKSHDHFFLHKLHDIRKAELQKKLENLTLDEIKPLCKKYDHTVYGKTKERLIEKFVNYLADTNNIDDVLFDLDKQALPTMIAAESQPQEYKESKDLRVCHIRLDEDYEQWRVFPKDKTKEDLQFLLDSFFNAKSKV